jgi:hypothetical protein
MSMPCRSGETIQEGGIGIIHKNISIDNQAASRPRKEVRERRDPRSDHRFDRPITSPLGIISIGPRR